MNGDSSLYKEYNALRFSALNQLYTLVPKLKKMLANELKSTFNNVPFMMCNRLTLYTYIR